MAKQEPVKVKKDPVKKEPAKLQNAVSVLTIDGVEYGVDSLSRNAKLLINHIRLADRELRRLEAQTMLARIARQTLASNLEKELAAIKA